MPIQVYNTLTRRKEPFETDLAGQGPHVRLRPDRLRARPTSATPCRADRLRRRSSRYLQYRGYQVRWVVQTLHRRRRQADRRGRASQKLRRGLAGAGRAADGRDYLDQTWRRWASSRHRRVYAARQPSRIKQIQAMITPKLIEKRLRPIRRRRRRLLPTSRARTRTTASSPTGRPEEQAGRHPRAAEIRRAQSAIPMRLRPLEGRQSPASPARPSSIHMGAKGGRAGTSSARR
jgi:hypothetical protein